jgi:hypothetical protein
MQIIIRRKNMRYLLEKVSYLRGLADGMELDQSTKEGKLLLNIIDVMEEFAEVMHEMDEDINDIDEFVDVIDQDLSEVEEEVFGEFDDDFDFDIDEVECPECGETIYTDLDSFCDEKSNMELECPNCGCVIEMDKCECGCCGVEETEA